MSSKSSSSNNHSDQTGSDQVTDDAISSLGSTVGSFANRIKRKLREQEERDGEAQREGEQRHARMLQAMTTIRRALQETCKINLGDRFALNVVVSDWDGWPRVELNLTDSLIPDKIEYALIVSAHDRRQRGVVQIHTRSGELLGTFELADPAELARIPLVLKRAVRSFLDTVAEYVLNPVKPQEILENDTKAISLDEPEAHPDGLHQADVFTDEISNSNENRVTASDDPDPIGVY